MRLLPVGLAAIIAAGTLASTGQSQRPDNQIDPRSQAIARQAQAALTAGRSTDAIDQFETALAVDPRNREAYIGLARVYAAQQLPGKAIRFYADALQIDGNDLTALEGQGEAYVQRGAVERARRNLTKLQQVCGATCAQATRLAAVIQRGPPPSAPTNTNTPAPPANGSATGNQQRPN